MFKNELMRRCNLIFGFEKTTFDAPSEKFEQDTLFLVIDSARSRIVGVKGGRSTSRVVGALLVFSQNDRFPYGYFTKRVENAPYPLTRDFFFYDFDQDVSDSPARMQNIHERRTNFIFFFDSQYDPDKGELNEVTFTIEE